jgi:hypothetical protein
VYSATTVQLCSGTLLKEFKGLELFSVTRFIYTSTPPLLPRAHPKTLHIPPVTKIGPHGCADDPQPPSLSNPLP